MTSNESVGSCDRLMSPLQESKAGEGTEPPAYHIAVELPTYEEYEQTKEKEDEENARRHLEESLLSSGRESSENADRVIGTDSMFIVGFIFSFLFNWLGLLVAFCVMHTCAGRFGAIAGFGLSIVKWVLIMKSNDWNAGFTDENSWVWWTMMAFGLLISCSGFLQYISIKAKWSRSRYTFII